jgi:tetratricopeptide (TPR) repeat protein
MLFFLGALLSKTVTASLPAVILLLIWWKKDSLRWRDSLPVIPMLLIGLGMALMTVWMELYHVGATGEEWVLTPLQRLIIAGRALWFYTQKIIWPSPLVFIYPKWNLGNFHPMLLLYPLSIFLIIGGLWLYRKKIGKGPLTAVLFFAGTLFPALGFFNVYPMRYSYVADHFQYLASIGMIVLLVTLLFHLTETIKNYRRTVRTTTVIFILLALTAWGHLESYKYMDLKSLWTDTISKNPRCWMALNNMGNLEISRRNYAGARKYFKKVLAIKPDFAIAYNNNGTSWLKEGNITEAAENFKKALSLDNNHAEAHNNLGVCLMRQKNIDDAISHYRQAITIKPEYITAHHNLGNAYSQKGLYDQAIYHYREALRIKPDLAMSHFQLGTVLYHLDRTDLSMSHLQTAIRLQPDFGRSYYQLALAFLKKRDLPQAEKNFLKTLQLMPEFTEAMNNLGIIYIQQNKIDQAISYLKKAIKIHPDNALAHNNLGIALEKNGNLPDAKTHFIEALRISPGYSIAKTNLLRVNKNLKP